MPQSLEEMVAIAKHFDITGATSLFWLNAQITGRHSVDHYLNGSPIQDRRLSGEISDLFNLETTNGLLAMAWRSPKLVPLDDPSQWATPTVFLVATDYEPYITVCQKDA